MWRLRRCIFNAIYLYLWYKIKDAVQKSTPPETKNFRDFHSQMQFSLNKLHFPDDLVGVKMAIFRRWWGRPHSPPPLCPPLGAASNIWAMVLNQTRGGSVGGIEGGAIPLGKFFITGHPPGTSARPLESFLAKTRKKKQNCRKFQILA